MTHTLQYKQYLNSLDWAVQRQRAIDRADNKCQRCGRSGEAYILQVHHLNYDRLGCELPTDLKVVCIDCHEKEDEERRVRTHFARSSARLDGWASKVYGEDWHVYMDEQAVAEEFEDWLDRQ